MTTKLTPHTVYHLVDPDTHAVKYVGKSRNPKSRYRQHIEESKEKQNTEKKRWIHGLLAQGKQPVLITVASYATEADARTRESRECHQHNSTILNIHDPAKGASDFRRTSTAPTKTP